MRNKLMGLLLVAPAVGFSVFYCYQHPVQALREFGSCILSAGMVICLLSGIYFLIRDSE